MLECIVSAVVYALEKGGVRAFPAYPRTPAGGSGPFAAVGVRSAAAGEPGFAGYLGTRTDESGRTAEIYGLACDAVLALDIYAPVETENAASDCLACFDRAAEALAGLRGGLRISGLEYGEAGPDRDSGMFRCRCGLKCRAFLTLESGGETAEFTDFILKGVLSE